IRHVGEDGLPARVDGCASAGVEREAVLTRARGDEAGAIRAIDLLRDGDARELDDLIRRDRDVLLAGLRDTVPGSEAAVLRRAVAVAGLVRELELVIDDSLPGGGEGDVEGDNPLARDRGGTTTGRDTDGRCGSADVRDPLEDEVVVEEEAGAVVFGEPHLHLTG